MLLRTLSQRFFRSSTKYRMEYQLFNKPMLFIGGRFLLDPISSLFQTYQSIFSCQELFMDEKILKKLYGSEPHVQVSLHVAHP
jgi:hypothetical protein